MDFVISEVATVEQQEDDEPLFEISKVTFFNVPPKPNVYKTKEVRPSPNRPTKYIKICYVPLCPNTSKSTPEKMFITIPVNPARRKLWLDAVGKQNGKNPKSPMFCCQDHFNLRKDMKNYDEHLKKGKVQMLLYQTVVPHTFICNNYGHLKRIERIDFLRKLHCQKYVNELNRANGELLLNVEKANKPTSPPKTLEAARHSKVETMPNKTIFIQMPEFEYEDHPEYVEINENGVDTIVIDDSD